MSFISVPTKVLVYDPNPLLAEALCSVLEQRGPFAAGTSGGDVLGSALAFQPNVIVVDPSRLPMAPHALRAELARHLPACEVVAYVDAGDNGAAMQCLAAGFAGVVSQGRSVDVLVQAVSAVDLGGVYIDEGFRVRAAPRCQGSASAGDKSVNSLSPRERHILEQVARGLSNKEIASPLGLSPKTVETHRARASSKLGLRSKSDIVQHALRNGWLSDPACAA